MTTTEQRPQTAGADQETVDAHAPCVVAGPKLLVDQASVVAPVASVGEDPFIPSDRVQVDAHKHNVAGNSNSTISQEDRAIRTGSADGGHNSLVDHSGRVTHGYTVGEDPNSRNGHTRIDDQRPTAVAGST